MSNSFTVKLNIFLLIRVYRSNARCEHEMFDYFLIYICHILLIIIAVKHPVIVVIRLYWMIVILL